MERYWREAEIADKQALFAPSPQFAIHRTPLPQIADLAPWAMLKHILIRLLVFRQLKEWLQSLGLDAAVCWMPAGFTHLLPIAERSSSHQPSPLPAPLLGHSTALSVLCAGESMLQHEVGALSMQVNQLHREGKYKVRREL